MVTMQTACEDLVNSIRQSGHFPSLKSELDHKFLYAWKPGQPPTPRGKPKDKGGEPQPDWCCHTRQFALA